MRHHSASFILIFAFTLNNPVNKDSRLSDKKVLFLEWYMGKIIG